MPSYSLKLLPTGAITKIAEVNPRRESLTLINHNSIILALADDDHPIIALNDIHGISLFPFTSLTLERESGDEPDKAWYVYNPGDFDLHLVVFEGVTPAKKRWW